MSTSSPPMSLLLQATSMHCANEDAGHSFDAMVRSNGASCLKSDCDEQLLLSFQFPHERSFHIDRVSFEAPAGSAAPKTVKVFVNTGAVQFETIDKFVPDDVVTLTWDRAPGGKIRAAFAPTKARRQAARQLVLFIEDNTTDGEDDVTVICGVDIIGRVSAMQGAFHGPPTAWGDEQRERAAREQEHAAEAAKEERRKRARSIEQAECLEQEC